MRTQVLTTDVAKALAVMSVRKPLAYDVLLGYLVDEDPVAVELVHEDTLADGDGGATAAADLGGYAGTADSRLRLNAYFRQGIGDQLRRAKFLETEFGVLVDITADANEFWAKGLCFF